MEDSRSKIIKNIVIGKLKGRDYSNFIIINDIKQILHSFRKIDDDETSKGYLKIKPSNSSKAIF